MASCSRILHNILCNCCVGFCQTISLLIRRGCNHMVESIRFSFNDTPEEMTHEDSTHEIYQNCELYGTHFPYERERAEMMENPCVKSSRTNVKSCTKQVQEGFRTTYNKHIGQRTIEFWKKHRCMHCIFTGVWRVLVSLIIGIKKIILFLINYAFTRPTYADVRQGGLGDCYFLAALSAIARTNPKHIKRHIKRHLPTAQWFRHIRTGDKRLFYDVAFYEIGPDGTYQKMWVTVDNVFKTESRGIQSWAESADCDGDGYKEIWVALYEKAYLKLRGGGDEEKGERQAGQGGTGLEAFPSLLGKKPVVHHFDIKSQELSTKDLRITLAASQFIPMMAGTHGSNDSEVIAEGVVAGHFYSILGLGSNFLDLSDAESEGEYVLLRNPWAKFEPGSDKPSQPFLINGDGVDDGVFRCPLKDFKRHFQYISCGDDAMLSQALSLSQRLDDSPSISEIKFALKRMRFSNKVRKARQKMSCSKIFKLAQPQENSAKIHIEI